jgi:hypothetical protein
MSLGRDAAPAAVLTPSSPWADEIDRIQRRRRHLAAVLLVAGLAVLAVLALHGGTYYLQGPAARLADPRHHSLRPSGNWSHGVGIMATLVMLANFLYRLRKHAPWMQRAGALPLWLTFHVFVGLMTPCVILFHAAFRFNNLIAVFTYGSLLVVVTTGLIGRYIYAMVPGAGGRRSEELTDLQRAWMERRGVLLQRLEGRDRPAWLARLLDAEISTRGASAGSTLRAAALWPARAARTALGTRRIAEELPAPEAAQLRRQMRWMMRARFQLEFFAGLKRLLAAWRFGHALLAVFLVAVIVVHVAVSLVLGYRWIF